MNTINLYRFIVEFRLYLLFILATETYRSFVRLYRVCRYYFDNRFNDLYPPIIHSRTSVEFLNSFQSVLSFLTGL